MTTNIHTNDKEIQNVWANRIDGTPIYIGNAESGRKGYYCQGCNCEMQAKKGFTKRKHHFSHQPNDVNRIGKCHYSDETYRHKLAKEILQRIKVIKVPSVVKYPPNGIEGDANVLRKSYLIHAEKVENELCFYEDADGLIKYSKSINRNDDKIQLLIQPDVTFFDKDGKPILLIELAATHKIDESKKWKIRRLMIDTIEVSIPKDSSEEIENTFTRTNRTKWIYNNEEATTKYIQLPRDNSKELLPIDELQERLFEESFTCRASEIRNLIRGIRKNLDSELYRTTEASLREELHRVERNTKKHGRRLDTLRAEIQDTIDESLRELYEKVFREEEEESREEAVESEDFNRRISEFERKYSDLERRYIIKRESLEREEKELRELEENFEPECQSEITGIESNLEQLGIGSKSFDERIREIRREEVIVEQEFRNEEVFLGIEKTRVEREIVGSEERRKGIPSDFREREDKLRTEFSTRTEEIRGEFEINRERTIREIEDRNIAGFSKSASRIKEVLDRRELLVSIINAINDRKRKRTAKQLFEEKSWKSWD